MTTTTTADLSARADAEQQLADAAREKTRAAEKELEQDLAKFEKCKEQRAAQAEKVDSKLAELSKAAELLEVTRKEVVDAMAEVNKNHISKWKEASMSRWASGGSNKVTPASTPTGASSLRGATPSQGFVQDFSRPQSFSRGSPTETRNSAFKESNYAASSSFIGVGSDHVPFRDTRLSTHNHTTAPIEFQQVPILTPRRRR